MEQNRSAALVTLLNELTLVSLLILLTAQQFLTSEKLFAELLLIKFVLYSLRFLQAA